MPEELECVFITKHNAICKNRVAFFKFDTKAIADWVANLFDKG
jgi:hypothetical protein